MAANNQYLLNKEIQKWYEKNLMTKIFPKEKSFFNLKEFI